VLTLAQVQAISASRLIGLNPIVRRATEELITRSFVAGVPIVIVQGLRTIEYQNQLFAQGRTIPGPIVTKAKGGHSFHNFGLAVDFALLMPDGRVVSWDTYRDGDKDGQRDWLEVATIGKSLWFEWGGDWDRFLDMPHFQMVFGLTTAQLRAGAKPPTIINEEDLPMTNEEKAAFDKLSGKVDELTSLIATLKLQLDAANEQTAAPKWFVAEFGSADLGGKISNPHFTEEGWRTLAISLRVKK
jgi:peptidoglycan L-alanyl-D-glutamate endopeptidase CwlK